MLVAAFAGRELMLDGVPRRRRAGFRFYSYGDAMLVALAGTRTRAFNMKDMKKTFFREPCDMRAQKSTQLEA